MYKLLLFFCLTATTLVYGQQAPQEQTGGDLQNTTSPSPTLLNSRSYTFSEGWSIAECYNNRGNPFLLLIKSDGVDRSGKNARIYSLRSDGSLGPLVKSYKWTEGWTAATFYYVGGSLHLMLVKKRGLSSTGHNVHCHRMNADGTVGTKVGAYRWSEGWTSFAYFYANNVSYMLQAKEKGFGGSGYNVRIRSINRDGSLGNIAHSYKWIEGWDTFKTFRKANKWFLLYAKSIGFSKDGHNALLRPINPDASLGTITDSQRWSQGWTSFTPYYLQGKVFVHQAKRRPTGPNAASKIREVNWNGSFSSQKYTEVIPAGRSYYSSIRANGITYLVGLRETGNDPGTSNNLFIYQAR